MESHLVCYLSSLNVYVFYIFYMLLFVLFTLQKYCITWILVYYLSSGWLYLNWHFTELRSTSCCAGPWKQKTIVADRPRVLIGPLGFVSPDVPATQSHLAPVAAGAGSVPVRAVGLRSPEAHRQRNSYRAPTDLGETWRSQSPRPRQRP